MNACEVLQFLKSYSLHVNVFDFLLCSFSYLFWSVWNYDAGLVRVGCNIAHRIAHSQLQRTLVLGWPLVGCTRLVHLKIGKIDIMHSPVQESCFNFIHQKKKKRKGKKSV